MGLITMADMSVFMIILITAPTTVIPIIMAAITAGITIIIMEVITIMVVGIIMEVVVDTIIMVAVVTTVPPRLTLVPAVPTPRFPMVRSDIPVAVDTAVGRTIKG